MSYGLLIASNKQVVALGLTDFLSAQHCALRISKDTAGNPPVVVFEEDTGDYLCCTSSDGKGDVWITLVITGVKYDPSIL